MSEKIIKLNDDLRPPPLVKSPDERMKQLVEKTKDVNVQVSIPIKRYFQSGRELLRMANTYLDEHDFEKAFVLYMRYITLFVEKLPNHGEYRTAVDADKKSVRANIKNLFEIAEEIKKKIKTKYNQEYEEYLIKKKEYDIKLEEANRLLQEQRKKQQTEKQNEVLEDFVSNFQSQIDKKKRELAEKKEKNLIKNDLNDVDINKSQQPSNEKLLELPEVPGSPSLSEEEEGEDEVEQSTNLPKPSASTPVKKPFFDRSTKPSLSLLDTHDHGDSLRQLIVPFKALTEKFQRLAQNNTDRNIETCGILCGQLKRDRFTITHILVPKQTGTSDSCTSINEEDLAIEQEKYNLITMGWIHTHPSQRAFLSSIDLHTHALYQKMLPEAIAIVVAPTFSEISMYSLTEHGLEYILKCRETGFHPHQNEQTLYQQSEHVLIDDNLSVIVIDLR